MMCCCSNNLTKLPLTKEDVLYNNPHRYSSNKKTMYVKGMMCCCSNNYYTIVSKQGRRSERNDVYFALLSYRDTSKKDKVEEE